VGTNNNIGGDGNLEIDARVIDGTSSGGFTKIGAGTLTLTGSNSYSGGTSVNAGVVSLGSATALGSTGGALAVGNNTAAAVLDLNNIAETVGALILGGQGTIQSTGGTQTLTTSGVTVMNGSNTIASSVNVTGSITQNSNSALTVSGTGGNDALSSTATLTGSGSGAVGAVTLAGNDVISGPLTTTGIQVSGLGNVLSSGTVTGAVTFSGTAALAINGTAGGSVTAGSGATVSGSGTILGAFSATSGSIIVPGTAGTAGTLHVGSGGMSLGTGTSLDFDLSSSHASGNDQIVVGGTLTIGSSSALTFNFNELTPGALDTTGAYQLITFTGTAPSLNGVTFTTTGDTGYTAIYSIDNGGEALDVAFTAANSTTPAAAFFNGKGTDLGTFSNFDTDVSSGTAVTSALGSTTNVSFNANQNTTVSTATLSTALDINSLTFGTGTGTHTGTTINGTGTLTIEATSSNNPIGNGITVNTGGGNNAINTAVALDNDQTWTVTDSTSTLTMGGPVSGPHMLSTAGAGVVALNNATGNSYSGGTVVGGTSTLLLGNSSGSGAGTGSLTVNGGATLGGTGSYGTSAAPGAHFSIVGSGTTPSTRANLLVGMNSSGDASTSTSLALIASSGTISNANLTFNISASHAGSLNSDPTNSGTELLVGNTAIGFGAGVSLTLNVQNEPGIIGAYTPYVLVAGTLSSGGGGVNGSQYSGLTLGNVLVNSNGVTETIITNSSLALAFSGSTDQSFYGANSYLVLYQSAGVDDIDVVVVPEPGTWAMMLGGVALLVLWQRRNRSGRI
jgi:fibronectin-binding autotransporter adhesin